MKNKTHKFLSAGVHLGDTMTRKPSMNFVFGFILAVALLLFSLEVFACGAPQPIYGRVQQEWLGLELPVYGATVRLTSPEGELINTRRTNPFGYYRFEDLMPCENYVVRAIHKSHVFLPELILASEFKGEGVEQDLWAYQGK